MVLHVLPLDASSFIVQVTYKLLNAKHVVWTKFFILSFYRDHVQKSHLTLCTLWGLSKEISFTYPPHPLSPRHSFLTCKMHKKINICQPHDKIFFAYFSMEVDPPATTTKYPLFQNPRLKMWQKDNTKLLKKV